MLLPCTLQPAELQMPSATTMLRFLTAVLPCTLQPGVLRWLRLAWRATRRVNLSEQVLMRYRTARLLELWEQSVQSLPQTPVSLTGAACSPVWHGAASCCQPSVSVQLQQQVSSMGAAWHIACAFLECRQTLHAQAGRCTLQCTMQRCGAPPDMQSALGMRRVYDAA